MIYAVTCHNSQTGEVKTMRQTEDQRAALDYCTELNTYARAANSPNEYEVREQPPLPPATAAEVRGFSWMTAEGDAEVFSRRFPQFTYTIYRERACRQDFGYFVVNDETEARWELATKPDTYQFIGRYQNGEKIG